MNPYDKILQEKIDAFRSGEDTNPIKLSSCGGSSHSVCYGNLVSLGLMTKLRVRGYSPDDHDIEWNLTKESEGLVFVDSYGETFSYPHSETWEK